MPAANASAVSLARLLTLVLALDEERPVSAAEIARSAQVSLREAVALAVAVQMLRTLPTLPFRTELDSAARKIAAAARVGRPELLREVHTWLRVEPPAADVFHPELAGERRPDDPAVGAVVQVFVEALLAGRSVSIDYRSPYGPSPEAGAEASSRAAPPAPPLRLDPAGVIADRGLWYLVAFPRDALRGPRYLRADRVLRCTVEQKMDLGRQARWRADLPRPWLHDAMRHWTRQSPVTLALSAAQWQRLARDWYFATGAVLPADGGGEGGEVHFTWGEGAFERVRELVAWLGPPARVVAPAAWVPRMRAALLAHAELHAELPAELQPDSPPR